MGFKNESLINTPELGRAIKRHREELKMSLRDVADEIGVSASTLSRIENGTGKPDADNIARLASWLDMPIERVMHHGQRGASDRRQYDLLPRQRYVVSGCDRPKRNPKFNRACPKRRRTTRTLGLSLKSVESKRKKYAETGKRSRTTSGDVPGRAQKSR